MPRQRPRPCPPAHTSSSPAWERKRHLHVLGIELRPGIADGAQHPAPVGVGAENGGISPGGSGPRPWPVCSACSSVSAPDHGAGDQPAGALAVAGDHLGLVARRRGAGRQRRCRSPRPGPVMAGLPARPLARTTQVSLVEVSPSTVMRLKVLVTTWRSMSCRRAPWRWRSRW